MDLIKSLKDLSENNAIYGVDRLVKQAQKLFPDVQTRNLREAATEALKTSLKRQIFSQPPNSTGKVSATFRNEIWQVDTADLSTYKQSLRGGHDYIIVAVDVFFSLYVCRSRQTTVCQNRSKRVLKNGRQTEYG